jgi:hypothetical protein
VCFVNERTGIKDSIEWFVVLTRRFCVYSVNSCLFSQFHLCRKVNHKVITPLEVPNAILVGKLTFNDILQNLTHFLEPIFSGIFGSARAPAYPGVFDLT